MKKIKKYLYPCFFGFQIIFFEDIVKEDIGIWSYFIKAILFIAGLMIFEENMTNRNSPARGSSPK